MHVFGDRNQLLPIHSGTRNSQKLIELRAHGLTRMDYIVVSSGGCNVSLLGDRSLVVWVHDDHVLDTYIPSHVVRVALVDG